MVRPLNLVSALLLCAAAMSSPDASAETQPVYVLDQELRSIGKQTTFISDKAVATKQAGMNRRTLQRAPDWNVLTINDDSHTWFACPAKSNTGLIMQRVMLFEGANFDKLKWLPVENGMIGGIAATRWVEAKHAKDWKMQHSGFEFVEQEIRRNGFWTAKEALVSAAAANALARTQGMPQIGKVPLRFYHITKVAGNRKIIVETYRCTKSNINIANLSVPASYKQSRSEFDGSVKDGSMMEAFFPLTTKGK